MITFVKLPLYKEITVVLIVKILALFILWFVCFSNPIKNQIDVSKMQQQLLDVHYFESDKGLDKDEG